MPTPILFPEVDTNKTRQPADPAGIPQAIKDDGFRENEDVPNTFWNWLFSLLNDWILWLLSSRLYNSIARVVLTGAVMPVLSISQTLPANAVSSDTTIIRMRGRWKITGENLATAGTIAVYIGNTPTLIYTALLATPLINQEVFLEVDVMRSAAALYWTVRDYRDGVSPPVFILDSGSLVFNTGLASTFQFIPDIAMGDVLDVMTCTNQSIEVIER